MSNTRYKTLTEVEIYGCVTHGHQDVVYDDNQIKHLVDKKAGAYGRHWVYGDRNGRRSLEMKECSILVIFGTAPDDQIAFVGRTGLNECLDFLRRYPDAHPLTNFPK